MARCGRVAAKLKVERDWTPVTTTPAKKGCSSERDKVSFLWTDSHLKSANDICALTYIGIGRPMSRVRGTMSLFAVGASNLCGDSLDREREGM